jgi:5-methylcytosine-specific restriction endonuclease McrA
MKRLPAYLLIEDARAAYLAQNHGLVPDDYKLRVIERLGGHCLCCGENHTELLTLDHIRPLDGARRTTGLWLKLWRGTVTADNLQLLCVLCNRAKSNKQECGYHIIARHVLQMIEASRAAHVFTRARLDNPTS